MAAPSARPSGHRPADRAAEEDLTAARVGPGSAVEQAVSQLAGIRRREPELQAWVRFSETWQAEARTVDEDPRPLPLRGMCLGVKDLIDVAGMPTRSGSAITSPEPAAQDAPCVARLRSLGAVVLGKTVTTEFGYFTPGPTRNPYALDHTPGGSSSGSAAAVGAGTIPLALGTQTAGSLTRPASYCGAAGMVMAHGSTDLSGVEGLSGSLDSLGLLTRTVADLRFVHDAFVGTDAAPTHPGPAPTKGLIWAGSDLEVLDPAMAALVQRIPDLLADAGLTSEPLEWDDHIHTLVEDHVTVMSFEAHRTRAQLLEDRAEQLSAPLRALLETGRGIPAAAATAALSRRDRSREALQEMLGSSSVVIGPAALGPAPAGIAATGSPVLSRPWQLLGLPIVVVPGARTTTGLPLGLQLIGMPGREHQLFDAGERLEAVLRDLPALSS